MDTAHHGIARERLGILGCGSRAMITRLRGRLTRLDPSGPAVELEVSGVGYEVLIPVVLWPEIQAIVGDRELDGSADGPELALHVFYHATANQPVPVLVGFLRGGERDFFRKLTTVEGIGPTRAVRAMNISVSTIARAIEQEDRATLVRLPGVGARAAEKMIATLRGKVTAEAAMHDGEIDRPVDAAQAGVRRVALDAAEAVAALGYSRSEARRWVEEALADEPELASVEEVTLAVLRRRGAER